MSQGTEFSSPRAPIPADGCAASPSKFITLVAGVLVDRSPTETPTAASKPGPRSFDSADRRIRFQEQEEKNPKCQGRIEWFMSKPDLGGYGEIVPDGGLEAAIGKILIHDRARVSGVVKFYNPHSSFGYIVQDDGSDDVYVHAKALGAVPGGVLGAGDKVEYRVAVFNERPRAKDVRVLKRA